MPTSFLCSSRLALMRCLLAYIVLATMMRRTPAGDPKDECGGWGCYTSADVSDTVAMRRGERNFCDIAVVDAADVDMDTIDPTLREKPLVLRGGGTLDRTAFGKASIMEVASKQGLQARVGYSWELIKGEGPRAIPLKDYLESVMHQDRFDGETRLERPYLFHRNPRLLQLFGRFNLPPLFASWGWQAAASWSILAVGGAESGTSWHRHNDAFEVVAYGWKRWLLYPPTLTPPGGSGGDWALSEWLRLVYPTLDGNAAPLECIIGPGDALYVPENWYHAVVNLADSVAVSIQKSTPATKKKQMFDAVPKQKDVIKAIRQILKLDPSDLDTRLMLARNLMERGKVEEAHGLYQQLADADPYQLEAMFSIYGNLARQFRASTVSKDTLLATLEGFRVHLENNTRSLMANQMLANYHGLLKAHAQEAALLQRNADLVAGNMWAGQLLPGDFQKMADAAWKRASAVKDTDVTAGVPAQPAGEGKGNGNSGGVEL